MPELHLRPLAPARGRIGASCRRRRNDVLEAAAAMPAAPIWLFVPAAVAERGRGGGEDRKKRRVFAHVRYFRGPRRRVTARVRWRRCALRYLRFSEVHVGDVAASRPAWRWRRTATLVCLSVYATSVKAASARSQGVWHYELASVLKDTRASQPARDKKRSRAALHLRTR
jgi:hypothetical protein